MRLSRGRGLRHGSHRDFDQERADLAEGYRSLFKSYEEGVQKVVDDETMTPEQKKSVLENYKAAMIQSQEEYKAQLDQINADEAEQTGYTQGEEADLTPGEAAMESCEEAQSDYAPQSSGTGYAAGSDNGQSY